MAIEDQILILVCIDSCAPTNVHGSEELTLEPPVILCPRDAVITAK